MYYANFDNSLNAHTRAHPTATTQHFAALQRQPAVHSLLYCHAARRNTTFTAHHPLHHRRHRRHSTLTIRTQKTPRVVRVVYREPARRRHSNVLFCSVRCSRVRVPAHRWRCYYYYYIWWLFFTLFSRLLLNFTLVERFPAFSLPASFFEQSVMVWR